MAERGQNSEESGFGGDPVDDARSRGQSADTAPEQDVREVVGRRGYDEGEDETAIENEEH